MGNHINQTFFKINNLFLIMKISEIFGRFSLSILNICGKFLGAVAVDIMHVRYIITKINLEINSFFLNAVK